MSVRRGLDSSTDRDLSSITAILFMTVIGLYGNISRESDSSIPKLLLLETELQCSTSQATILDRKQETFKTGNDAKSI